MKAELYLLWKLLLTFLTKNTPNPSSKASAMLYRHKRLPLTIHSKLQIACSNLRTLLTSPFCFSRNNLTFQALVEGVSYGPEPYVPNFIFPMSSAPSGEYQQLIVPIRSPRFPNLPTICACMSFIWCPRRCVVARRDNAPVSQNINILHVSKRLGCLSAPYCHNVDSGVALGIAF